MGGLSAMRLRRGTPPGPRTVEYGSGRVGQRDDIGKSYSTRAEDGHRVVIARLDLGDGLPSGVVELRRAVRGRVLEEGSDDASRRWIHARIRTVAPVVWWVWVWVGVGGRQWVAREGDAADGAGGGCGGWRVTAHFDVKAYSCSPHVENPYCSCKLTGVRTSTIS